MEFEEARDAIDRLRAAGIRIGRVQLSSALDIPFPSDAARSREMVDQLRAFADATYLHQVVERSGSGLRHFLDLPDALERRADAASTHWRIHFHVPLFTNTYDQLGSTQAYVADVLAYLLRTGATRHLEIETYTWDVLPKGLKVDLLESIAREYDWVLATVGHGSRPA